MITKSQRYSQLVFQRVQNLVQQNDDGNQSIEVRRYKSLCKRSGGVLRSVGLIQYLTFLAAKAGQNNQEHYGIMLDHLRVELQDLNIVNANNTNALLIAIQRMNLRDYMRTTSVMLRLLQWHKRIADVLISGTAEED